MFEVTQGNREIVLARFSRYGAAVRYVRGLLNAGEREVFIRAVASPEAA